MDVKEMLSSLKADFLKKSSEFQSKFEWVEKYLDEKDFEEAKIVEINDPEKVNKPIEDLIVEAFPKIKRYGGIQRYMVFSQDEKIKVEDYYLDIENSALILGVEYEYEYEYEAEYSVSLRHWFFFSKPIQWELLWTNIKETEKEAFVNFLKKLYRAE